VWAGVSGLGVALGPLVGGAVVEGIAWQWIFWLNVPVGLVLLPLARRMLSESHGPNDHLDLPGLALGGAGLLGLTFGIVRADALGWTSTTVVASLVAGVALLAAFLAWRRAPPSPCCRRASSPTAGSPRPTACRSRCSSGPSARSSC
jgi:MFS family permease